MEDARRRFELAEERYRNFQSRKRTAGDGPTWVVVLSAFELMMVVFAASYGEDYTIASISFVAFIIWFIVLSILGRIAPFSILMGRNMNEQKRDPNLPVIVNTGWVVLAFGGIAMLINLFGGWSFGLYGLVCLAAWIALAPVLFKSHPARKDPA